MAESLTQAAVLEALRSIQDPDVHRDTRSSRATASPSWWTARASRIWTACSLMLSRSLAG